MYKPVNQLIYAVHWGLGHILIMKCINYTARSIYHNCIHDMHECRVIAKFQDNQIRPISLLMPVRII